MHYDDDDRLHKKKYQISIFENEIYVAKAKNEQQTRVKHPFWKLKKNQVWSMSLDGERE